MSTEVLFYHLERQSLDDVLPSLVEKTLGRGWRAVIQAGSAEKVEQLDLLLWTYADDSFVPHGTSRDGAADRQPIYLTTGSDNPNGAEVRFLVDGATCDDVLSYVRLVYLFDGRDSEAVQQARQVWKTVKTAGAQPTYWQQTASGGWERKG